MIPPATLLALAGVLAAAMATPGPTTATIVTHAVAKGRSGLFAFSAGLILADIVWLSISAFGLAEVTDRAPAALFVFKAAGAAYVFFMGYTMWTKRDESGQKNPSGGGLASMSGGLMLGLSNPKTMIFYLALLPMFLPLGNVGLPEFLQVAVTLVVVYGAVLAFYILAAGRLRSALGDPAGIQRVRRFAAVILFGTGVAVLC